ncbi:MAG: hypothetical protein ABIP07_08150 [Sphingomicrobium sp.]
MTVKQPRSDSTPDQQPGLRERATDAIDGAREKAVEAYDSARDQASVAGARAKDSISEAPLLALGGGLALGALIAAFLPRTKVEDKLLGPVGERVTGGAKAAATAAKVAGQGKLAELNITRDAGTSAVQSLIKGLGDAAKSSGEAALGAVRRKD